MWVLTDIIHGDQVGFVAGWQTPDARRRVLNLLRSARLCLIPSILLSLGVELAFNTVHWGYLKAVSLKFGLSGWILSTSALVLSGFISKYFPSKNGTRQGCPLSPIIFALLMDTMATKIRDSEKISGIQVESVAYKISLYINDVI